MEVKQTRRQAIPFGWKIIDAIQVVLPAGLAAFGASATLLLLAGQLRSALVWPLGLLAAAVAIWVVVKNYPAIDQSRERFWANAVVYLGVLAWGSFNFLHTAQHIITNRDPGTYTNTAIWLVHHNNLNITQSGVFGSVSGASGDSPGFFSHNGHLLAQGLHLLPIFLGLIGRIVGVSHMLHFSVLFGMTALLSVYAFARQIAKPYWAMVVTGALAASMPLIYFSRDTYSEPLAATFTFGALALIWVAIKSKKTSIWFIAGLVAGAGMLTRVDALLTIAELLLFAGIMLALSRKDEKRFAIRNSAALIVGMAVTAIIGWLDISHLSTQYYQSLHHDIMQEILAIVLAAVVSLGVVALTWRYSFFTKIFRAAHEWLPSVVALLVLLLAILLASRPLWYKVYDHTTGSMHSFAELTTEWVTWYLGPLLAILGALGLAIGSAYTVKKRQLFLLASLLVVGCTTLFYLTIPSISPDQIWASRRLVPVILPGVAAFGAICLDLIFIEFFKQIRWRNAYIVLASLAILLGPLITSKPLIRERDTALLASVNDTCRSLPPKASVLWIGMARSWMVEPSKELCNIEAEGYGPYFVRNASPSRNTLAQVAVEAQRRGYVPIVGLYGSDISLLIPESARNNFTTVSTFTESQLDNPITRAPDLVDVSHDSILMSIIQPDGSTRPL